MKRHPTSQINIETTCAVTALKKTTKELKKKLIQIWRKFLIYFENRKNECTNFGLRKEEQKQQSTKNIFLSEESQNR